MKRIKSYLGILMMLTLLVGFTSCEDDDDMYDSISDRQWVGNLGFIADNGEILENHLYFDSHGYGEDQQVYAIDGKYYGYPLPYRWNVRNGSLYIDYNDDSYSLEIRGLYVKGRRMSGDLYVNGSYEYPVELYRN